MIKALKAYMRKNIEENSKAYILLLIAFAAGFALAALLQRDKMADEEIKLYIQNFFSNIAQGGTSGGRTFSLSMLAYLRYTLILLVSSVTVIGAPIVPILVGIQGFSFGTVISSTVSVFGAKAYLLFLCAILPHIMISAPCSLVFSFQCMRNAHGLFLGDRNMKRNLLLPLLSGAVFLLVISLAALVQAYVEPLLLSLISKYFV